MCVIIAVYSKFNLDHLLKLGSLGLMAAVGALVCFEVGMLSFYPWKKNLDAEEMNMNIPSSYSPFPYEAIGSGALMLNPNQTWGWVSHIAKELCVIAHNSRPDAVDRDAKILLSLKTGQDQKTTTSGKVLFLQQNEESGSFAFSEVQQPLWVKPILLDNGRVLIEVGKKMGQLETAHGHEEKGQFVVPASSVSSGAGQNRIQEALGQLKNARCWGRDLFIQHYGGAEFGMWKEKYKIEFSQGYVSFVAAGDYLIWKQGRWEEGGLSDLSAEQPVAAVKSVSPKGIELTVWDDSGFYPVQVQLPLEHPGKFSLKPDATPMHPRLRTASQISCMLGKKRVILRQGDWLIKTATGWRNLRRKEDIENCLQHRLKGELFIFDALEKEQGKWVLKGTLFDEMRTQVQNISVPIEAEHQSGKRAKKRKIPFSPKGAVQ